ncbi:hypothetical protein PSY31_22660, partial [Shigella flexneri]|nr:hypothetical protein [Shigella flexneri]
QIAQHLPGRTYHEIKNDGHSHLKKRLLKHNFRAAVTAGQMGIFKYQKYTPLNSSFESLENLEVSSLTETDQSKGGKKMSSFC